MEIHRLSFTVAIFSLVLVSNGDESSVSIAMDGFRPPSDDYYACTSIKVTKEEYIVSYETESEVSVAHHILLFGCDTPGSTDKTWACAGNTCSEERKILYAWARNAPPTNLPKDVGYGIGGDSGVNYLVLQIHYLSAVPESSPGDQSGITMKLTTEKPLHIAGVFLFAGIDPVPANNPKAHVDVTCTFQSTDPIHLFAFRTHAHSLATVITGYRHRGAHTKGSSVSGGWREVAKANPQWPQAFYPMEHEIVIRPGEHMAVRCTYNTTGRMQPVQMGMTHNDEMCNLYLMYYANASTRSRTYYQCAGNRIQSLAASMPSDSDVPPPPNPVLDAAAAHHHHHGGAPDHHGDGKPGGHTGGGGKEKMTPSTSTPEIGQGSPTLHGHNVQVLKVRMPEYRPHKEDVYVCSTMGIHADAYLVQFEALTNGSTNAHHMMLFGCNVPLQQATYHPWECSSPCQNGEKILWAWARGAAPTQLPEDVGFHVGGDSGINFLVLQIHYKQPIRADQPADTSGIATTIMVDVPKFTAGMLVLDAWEQSVPPHKERVDVHVSCEFPGTRPVNVFAYRTHAHSLAVEVSGYKFSNSKWTELGRASPQGPQPFYPKTPHVRLSPGDKLVATCQYNSTSRSSVTPMGGRHTDEMCNLYLMYYGVTSVKQSPLSDTTYMECTDDKLPLISAAVPKGQRTPDHLSIKSPLLVLDKSFVSDIKSRPHFGQPVALSTDTKGNVYVFHRASAVWTAFSFSMTGKFLEKGKGPIAYDVITVFDQSGAVIESWGKNMFYMPHGITVDREDNVWVTDVAMHQVMKFSKGGSRTTPSLTLGVKFEPGSDTSHFCKPTDVAVRANGEFYISDGYCNGRILHYLPDGTFLKEWGEVSVATLGGETPPPMSFFVPHSLTLYEPSHILCVADRENERIQCFDLEGNFRLQLKDKRLKYIYAIEFSPDGQLLYMVTQGESTLGLLSQSRGPGQLFAYSLQKRTFVEPMESKPLILSGEAHDVCTDSEGRVYVAEMKPKVWKLSPRSLITANSQNTDSHVTKATESPPAVISQTPKGTGAVTDGDKSIKGDTSSGGHAATKQTDDSKKHSSSENTQSKASELKVVKGSEDKVERSQVVPIVVGVVLLVALLVGVTIFAAVRYCPKNNGHSRFNVGEILRGKPKGFDRVSTTEDYNFDSEEDEYYTAPPQS